MPIDPYAAYRRQQPQQDIQPMPVQQPAPMYAQPAQLPQWQPIEQPQQQDSPGAMGGNLADILSRFKRPNAGGPSAASQQGSFEAD